MSDKASNPGSGLLIGLIAGAALIGIALACCGCGKNDTTTTTSAPAAAGESDLFPESAKVLESVLGAKYRGLDPMNVSDTTSSAVSSQGYECLYSYHYLKRPYQIEPCLAAALPTISDDQLTYTIPIRNDVYFFDDACFPSGKGRQLVANDFIYAWKRLANAKNVSVNWPFLAGRIAGLDDFNKYTSECATAAEVDYSTPVAGLKAIDDFTLQITLTQRWPQLIYVLAHLPTAPVAKEAVECYGDRFKDMIVGTGPFMMKPKRGNDIFFVRNPNFRDVRYPSEGEPGDREAGLLDDAGKRLPLIDGIHMQIIEEDQPMWLLFMQGKLDASGIPKDFFAQAVTPQKTLTPQMEKKGITMRIQEDPATYWYAFNMADPVVGKNLPLRRAMSCAFNRETYIRVFTNGRGIPAKGIFPPCFKEYDAPMTNPWCEYNLDRAKELMVEAERIHGGQITVTLSVGSSDSSSRQHTQFFQREMEKIGVTIKADYMDWPTLLEKVKNKSAQMYGMGWVADYPDGESFLQVFYGPNGSPGPNNANYNNPAFDELYKKAVILQDSPERVAMYRQLEQLAIDDCPCIFTLHNTAYVPFYKYLKNMKENFYIWGAARYRNIDLALRKELVGR